MYILFVNDLLKTYVVRLEKSAESGDQPDDSGAWVLVGDYDGLLDTLAAVVARSDREGWRSYEIKLDDVR